MLFRSVSQSRYVVVKFGVAECQNCGIEESEIISLKNKETLEEAMNQEWYIKSDYNEIWRYGVIELGAKWQAERMYSEEEMLLAFETGRNYQLTGENNFKELIEQLKKK